jgi:hypothetical protein
MGGDLGIDKPFDFLYKPHPELATRAQWPVYIAP